MDPISSCFAPIVDVSVIEVIVAWALGHPKLFPKLDQSRGKSRKLLQKWQDLVQRATSSIFLSSTSGMIASDGLITKLWSSFLPPPTPLALPISSISQSLRILFLSLFSSQPLLALRGCHHLWRSLLLVLSMTPLHKIFLSQIEAILTRDLLCHLESLNQIVPMKKNLRFTNGQNTIILVDFNAWNKFFLLEQAMSC